MVCSSFIGYFSAFTDSEMAILIGTPKAQYDNTIQSQILLYLLAADKQDKTSQIFAFFTRQRCTQPLFTHVNRNPEIAFNATT